MTPLNETLLELIVAVVVPLYVLLLAVTPAVMVTGAGVSVKALLFPAVRLSPPVRVAVSTIPLWAAL